MGYVRLSLGVMQKELAMAGVLPAGLRVLHNIEQEPSITNEYVTHSTIVFVDQVSWATLESLKHAPL
jgi:hypothetical protein